MKRYAKALAWLPQAVLLALAALLASARGQQQGQQFIQYGFEAHDPIWVRGNTDARPKESAHSLTDLTAHSGKRSEFFQLNAELGNYIHYTYDPGRAPI